MNRIATPTAEIVHSHETPAVDPPVAGKEDHCRIVEQQVRDVSVGIVTSSERCDRRLVGASRQSSLDAEPCRGWNVAKEHIVSTLSTDSIVDRLNIIASASAPCSSCGNQGRHLGQCGRQKNPESSKYRQLATDCVDLTVIADRSEISRLRDTSLRCLESCFKGVYQSCW